MEILQGHVDKPRNESSIDKMIKKKNVSNNQLNLGGDFPIKNLLETLVPKQSVIKMYDVIKKCVGNSSNRTKVNATDNTVCNFQSMKTPVELNSLLSKFFCYTTWFVISPD